MALDEERNDMSLFWQPGFGTVTPRVSLWCHPSWGALQQADGASGGYLILEVSEVWLPKKGISAWPRQGPEGSGVAYVRIWGQSSRRST